MAINDYGDPRNNLPSCVEDATVFENLLRESYKFDEIQSLLDLKASKKNVENCLNWLFKDVQPDDRLVFFYSGHGYALPRKGIMEEVLVLHDGFFEDDTLAAMSQNIPPRTLTVFLDSCFSGGMEKMMLFSSKGLEVAKPKT